MSRIDASFSVCALLGLPARHSLGPAIHNAAFEHMGLPYVYVAHDVVPDDLPAAMAGARALGYRGLSITMPHKVAALALVDEVDPVARAIGCINTVVWQGGRLIGYNSDGQGALGALKRAGITTEGRRVLLLGSGGAARAIAMTIALRGRPAQIAILGVLAPELAALGRDISVQADLPVSTAPADEPSLAAALAHSDVLVHCTPVGMTPDVDSSLVPARLLRADLAVLDAVYNPRRTRLLKDAAAAGCVVVEGMEMFLGQAMVQFELWTQKSAPGDVMRAVVDSRL
jgi:shikimate dehydrogenase